MARPTKYPEAVWLGNGVSGGSYYSADGVLGPFRIVLHTTETSGMPSYSAGKYAPHLTYNPKQRKWYQHTSLGHASRALRNEAGGVQTNRERSLQVEIICYSNKPLADQEDYRLWVGDLTADNYADLRAFIVWAMEHFDVQPIYPGRKALNYTKANIPGFRMDVEEWDQFGGVCGHQHVPENTHWDPGALDWQQLLTITQEQEEPMALTEYEQRAIDSLLDDGIFTSYTVDEEGEVYAEVQLKKLAVFLQRVMDRQEASDEALWDAIREIEENGGSVDLTGYIKKGEQVTLS